MAPLELLPDATLGEGLNGLVEALALRPWAQDFYLGGTAALHLYLGHRRSPGLDLMSGGNRLDPQRRRDLLSDLLKMDPQVRVETARNGYLFVRMAEGTGLKFFYYPYPLVDPEQEYHGLELASALDLGLMKLGAIISRGSRRDFVDLYLLCRRLPLEELLRRAAEKFGHVRDFSLQALKGLADLSLVAGEPMPSLRVEVQWSQVESWLRSEVRRLGREKVGLPPVSQAEPDPAG
jgi:hypothetical protein